MTVGSWFRATAAIALTAGIALSTGTGFAQTEPAPAPEAAPATPAPAAPAPSDIYVHSVSLADLGDEDGLAMNGISGFQTMVVPIPRNSEVVDGAVNIVFDAVMPDYTRQNLRMLVNDIPVTAQMLQDEERGTVISHRLNAVDLAQDEVRVDMQLLAAITENRCFDQRVAAGSVVIRPESGVALAILPESINGVGAALELLPQEVVIGVEEGPVSPDAFAGALLTAIDLQRRGHDVIFSTLPAATDTAGLSALVEDSNPSFDPMMRPHIVVARPSTVSALARFQYPAGITGVDREGGALTDGPEWTAINGTAVEAAGGEDGLVSVMRFGTAPVIAIADENAPLVAAHLSGEYDRIAIGPAVLPRQVEPTFLTGGSNTVTFEDLGLEEVNNNIVTAGDFFFPFRLVNLPPGEVPQRLDLDIVVPPALGDLDNLLYVYYNESLVEVIQLENAFGVQEIAVDLPQRLHRTFNQVRLTVQREDLATPCETLPQGFATRVLDSSSIRTRPVNLPPSNFAELTSLFDDRTEIYLPEDFLSVPSAALTLASRLLVDVVRDPVPGEVLFRSERAAFAPTGPYILLGNPQSPDLEAPIRFDRGRVILTDQDDEVVLDVLDTANTAVAQVSNIGSTYGLWIAPTNRAFPNPEEISLDRGDVAFIDRRGTFLEIASETDTVVEVEYPEERTWVDVLQQYRIYILAAVVILLLILFITLFQSVMRNWRRTRDEASNGSNQG